MLTTFQKFLICGIIIFIHVVIFLFVSSSPTSEQPTDVKNVQPAIEATGDQSQSNESAANQGIGSDVQTGGAQSASQPSQSSISNTPAITVSSFSSSLRTLPPGLQKQTGKASEVIVIDQDAHCILWQKSANATTSIASISKLMTALLIMEDVTSGKASLNDVIKVTKDDKSIINRWGHGCWIAAGESYTLQELLKAIMISSANDCAYLAARHLAGTNDRFVARMNQRAKELGLTTMKFASVNGHPNVGGNLREENYGSAMDVAKLADIVTKYPEIMKWAGTKQERLRENAKNPFDLHATNHLLRDKVPGITGLKTGYTDAAGYCIVATCERNGRHIMVVVLGISKDAGSKERDALTKNLLNWAYGN